MSPFETIKDRIDVFITTQQIKRSRFERSCGFSNGYTRNLKENPSASKIEDILRTYPNLNRVWLLTGEGEMLNTSLELKPSDDAPATENDDRESCNYFLVPLINIDSVGGVHADANINKIPIVGARDGDIAVIQSDGSMSPTIPQGAILHLREVANWRDYLGFGNIYVLRLSDGRCITKELQSFSPDTENFVRCVSLNPAIADEKLPRSMICNVWKVIRYIAAFGW